MVCEQQCTYCRRSSFSVFVAAEILIIIFAKYNSSAVLVYRIRLKLKMGSATARITLTICKWQFFSPSQL